MDYHAVSGRGQGLDDSRQRGNNSRGILNPLLSELKPMASSEPADDGLIERVHDSSVAEDSLVQTALQSLTDEIGGLEVHVRDPERD